MAALSSFCHSVCSSAEAEARQPGQAAGPPGTWHSASGRASDDISQVAPWAQRKTETPCCEAEAPSRLQSVYVVRVSCTGSELLCRSSAGAADASSLALTCKATVSNVEHESEVHVSVILLSILLFLFVTVLLSLALLLLLCLGVLCLANTRNCTCLTVLCQKTDRCHPCPISCQRKSSLKPLLEKPPACSLLHSSQPSVSSSSSYCLHGKHRQSPP